MRNGLQKKRELTLPEKRAAYMWVEGFDVDGTPASTKKEIALLCGMTEQQLYILFKREDFLDEVDKLYEKQRRANERELLKNVPKAIRKLTQLMDTGQDREALQAATKLLALAGYSQRYAVDINVNDEQTVVRGGFGRELTDGSIIDVSDEPEDDDADASEGYDADA